MAALTEPTQKRVEFIEIGDDDIGRGNCDLLLNDNIPSKRGHQHEQISQEEDTGHFNEKANEMKECDSNIANIDSDENHLESTHERDALAVA